MNKQTKLYLGLGAIAVGGYLLYKQMYPAKMPVVTASTGAPVNPESGNVTAPFAGQDQQDVVGNRMKMVGNFVGDNANVRSSNWLRGADGSSIAPNFFDVASSHWVRS